MTITQLLPALLRTVVPLLYGLLIQLGLGRYVDDQTVTTIATVAILAAVYLVLRLLEHLQPWIGVLLGWAKQPQYADIVQGQVLEATDVVEAATKDDLAQLGDQLRDQVASVIEEKVTTSVSAAVTAASKQQARTLSAELDKAVHRAAAKPAKKTPAKKTAAAKPAVDDED